MINIREYDRRLSYSLIYNSKAGLIVTTQTHNKGVVIMNTDFITAAERSMHIRRLYQQLEERNHNGAWTTEEDMLAFTTDIGALGRLVISAEGRWVYNGEVKQELSAKLAECLWWIFVLSGRLNVNIAEAFILFLDKLENDLTQPVTAVKPK